MWKRLIFSNIPILSVPFKGRRDEIVREERITAKWVPNPMNSFFYKRKKYETLMSLALLSFKLSMFIFGWKHDDIKGTSHEEDPCTTAAGEQVGFKFVDRWPTSTFLALTEAKVQRNANSYSRAFIVQKGMGRWVLCLSTRQILGRK